MSVLTPAVHLSETSQAILDGLDPCERMLAIQFICPNGQPLTDQAVGMFYNFTREGVIKFTDQGTANVHLHVSAPVGASVSDYCIVCQVMGR